MAIDLYQDLVLLAEDVKRGADGTIEKLSVRVFDSPAGQGEQKEIVTVPRELRRKLAQLAGKGRLLDQDPEAQIDLGEMLGGLLLPPYARQLLSASLTRLRSGQGLRLRLRLADELADVPWEYAYIRDARGERTSSGFLALDPRLSIVRHEALATPGDWFETPSTRRVVVAMASPSGEAELSGLPEEQRMLREALQQVAGVRAHFVPDLGAAPSTRGATLKDVVQALSERTDVFHFSGHGRFTEDGLGPALGSTIGAGEIVLTDEKGGPVYVPADRFAELLRGKGIRLAVLNACEGARRDGYQVWSGVAAALLKAGIPAVVAMQLPVYDDLAAELGGAMYRALVAGLCVDEAVVMGRIAMRAAALKDKERRDCRDWAAPVLYLRSPGGVVFNPVSDAAARDKAEEDLGLLVRQNIGVIAPEGRVVGAVIGEINAHSVKVEQRVEEGVQGVMVGASVYSVQGGRLSVEQRIQKVSGTVIGARIGVLGGGAPKPPSEEQIAADLEKLLQVRRA